MKCPVFADGASTSTSPVPIAQELHKEGHGKEEVKLAGDLASAQVGVVKRFSIDVPGRDKECNVLVTHG